MVVQSQSLCEVRVKTSSTKITESKMMIMIYAALRKTFQRGRKTQKMKWKETVFTHQLSQSVHINENYQNYHLITIITSVPIMSRHQKWSQLKKGTNQSRVISLATSVLHAICPRLKFVIEEQQHTQFLFGIYNFSSFSLSRFSSFCYISSTEK